MARSVTWDELRELAEFEAEHGCAVSLYVNLDPSVAPTPADVAARVRSLLDEAGRPTAANQPELSHAQRQAFAPTSSGSAASTTRSSYVTAHGGSQSSRPVSTTSGGCSP